MLEACLDGVRQGQDTERPGRRCKVLQAGVMDGHVKHGWRINALYSNSGAHNFCAAGTCVGRAATRLFYDLCTHPTPIPVSGAKPSTWLLRQLFLPVRPVFFLQGSLFTHRAFHGCKPRLTFTVCPRRCVLLLETLKFQGSSCNFQ